MFVKEICSSFLVNEIADGKLNWSKMAGISGFSSSPAAPTSKSDAISSKNKPAVLTRTQNFRKILGHGMPRIKPVKPFFTWNKS